MKLTIRTRLLAAFGLVLTLACGLGLFGLYELRSLKANADEVTGNWMPSVKAASAMNDNLADYRLKHFRMLIAADPTIRTQLNQAAQEDQARLGKLDEQYLKLISSPEERAIHEKFLTHWQRYAAVATEFRAHVMAGRDAEAKALLQETMPKDALPAAAQLDALVDLNQKGADTEAQHVSATYDRAVQASATTIVVMLLVGAVLAWRIAGDIGRRMRRATAVADGIAGGDLSQAIEVQGQDEIAELQQALSRMQTQLAQVVGEVRQNADSVATASAEIAQGNQDLSSRTEEQASALQQTAASMEQLGATVKQNADNALQANQLAAGASHVAVKGGDVVDEVVRTMRDINASSSKIADIISVIDGIAFQTNILALNAAVEAARAGEQGRGFAVVASEVRSLAQRSAEAAKEIKTLITASVERVEQGTILVDQAGSTMTEVVTAIRRVTDIMGEISAASSEQHTGVAQVGDAVSQMDQATQQNAALVEESAAAAESLKHQAQQLVQAVSVFQLKGTAAAGAASSKPAPASQHSALLVKKPVSKPAVVKQRPPAPVLASAAGDWASF